MAQALEGGAIEKPPWYAPFDGAPNEPVIKSSPEMEFDSLVVDAPSPKVNKTGGIAFGDRSRQAKDEYLTTSSRLDDRLLLWSPARTTASGHVRGQLSKFPKGCHLQQRE